MKQSTPIPAHVVPLNFSLAFIMVVATILATPRAARSQTDDEPKPHKKGLIDQVSGQGFGMAGCGVGSILFGETPGLAQVAASLTNQIYFNNTFAGTSGTSNCEDADPIDARTAQVFIDSNRVAIENDIAKGSGETLQAFFELAGCSPRGESTLSLHRHYQEIFVPGAKSIDVVKSIRQFTTCSRLG